MSPMPVMGTKQPEFPFAFGLPDPGSFPRRELQKVAKKVIDEQIAIAMQYGNFQGDAELREVIAERVERLEGASVERDNILITNGSSHGLSLVAQLLVDPGDT